MSGLSDDGDEGDDWEDDPQGPSTSRGKRGPYKRNIQSQTTPGGPLTEERIADMDIVKYEDYVSLDDSLGQQNVSATDFWKETSVNIIIHVRQPFFVMHML